MPVPVVTSVRARGARGVEVHLDGAPWRTVPLDCAVAARLDVGVPLDRERARALARALRRDRALRVAVRALRSADHSRVSLAGRLERHGVGVSEREAAIAVLERAGAVDDARLADERADLLARRGHGDAAIRADLERRGVPEELAARAVGALEPEHERGMRVVAARGRSARTWRLLAARGFSEDVVEELIAMGDDEGLG